MRCLRCGNSEHRFFYKDQSVWYCRKCIGFGRMNVNEVPKRTVYERKKHSCTYDLDYGLTPKQHVASEAICYHTSHHQSVLAYAVCGAGKTEMVMEVMKKYLNEGKKVGFAISRRQVVLEIKE
ncbi:MAG: helicase, partial [Longicatena sp.]